MDTITVEKREAIQEAMSRLVDLLLAETTVEDVPDEDVYLDDTWQNNNSC
jgi:hypothetical protein